VVTHVRVADVDKRRRHRRASLHRHRQPVPFGPPHYLWAVVALAAVLVVFYFANRT
jgi:hypothetical protein